MSETRALGLTKIGLFKDCIIQTPFLELIQGHEAQGVPPGQEDGTGRT